VIAQSLFGFEFILTCAADGADEIFGEVFEGGAGGDAVIGVADGRIIFPATNVAGVLAHSILLMLLSTGAACVYVFHSVALFRPLGIVEKIQRADKVSGDAADALKPYSDPRHDLAGTDFGSCLSEYHKGLLLV
jgi:hypothetical protein